MTKEDLLSNKGFIVHGDETDSSYNYVPQPPRLLPAVGALFINITHYCMVKRISDNGFIISKPLFQDQWIPFTDCTLREDY